MVLEMSYQNCNVKEKLHILKQQWAELLQKPEHQKIRIKDAADILNVSEAELLSTTIRENTCFLKIGLSINTLQICRKSLVRWMGSLTIAKRKHNHACIMNARNFTKRIVLKQQIYYGNFGIGVSETKYC